MRAIWTSCAALLITSSLSCGDASKPEVQTKAKPEAQAKAGPEPSLEPSPRAEPEIAGEAPAEAPPVQAPTPNELYARGMPTFVLGTAGDELADREIAAQVNFIRVAVFPAAAVVTDTSIDLAAGPGSQPEGPGSWPTNPVLYGGPHVNAVLAELAPTLPFELSSESLVIGGETFTGPGYRLIAAIPSRPADAHGPGYPQFVLYSGTGTPGVAEINGVSPHGAESILIADQFGRLVTGRWVRGEDGVLEAELSKERAPRPAWRSLSRDLAHAGGSVELSVHFLEAQPVDPQEQELVEACSRGVATVLDKLGIEDPVPLSIYIYPDAETKRRLTNNAGHGTAVVSSRAVHVIRFDPSVGGGLESLLAHEATHVLAHEGWGPAGSSLFGEGLAVWVSAQYGGETLDTWRGQIGEHAPISTLLGRAFMELPEPRSYPLAGLVVGAVVSEVGAEGVRAHLLGATAESWASACEQAGTTPAQLEQALAAALAG